MKFKQIMIIFVVIGLSSCVSGKIVYFNEPMTGTHGDQFTGKTIGVEPFEIEFSAKRFAIDLRGLKMTINGQEIVLQKTYLKKIDEDKLGKIGILEVNALEKTGSDKQAIQDAVNKEWISGLLGKTNYNLGYFNGFGEGNSGLITNVPVEFQSFGSVNYLPADKETTYFSEVRDLSKNQSRDGLDYILRGNIDLSNEVAEVLVAPVDEYGSPVTDRKTNVTIQNGQYYLLLNAYIEWEIIDVNTGEVVVNHKEKNAYFMDNRVATRVLLPVQNGDSGAFTSYFRNNDLTQYAIVEILDIMPRSYQFMAPFYNATGRFVKDEE